MNRRLTTCGIALICMSASSAYAFMEEGNDDLVRLGYLKCTRMGDLSLAEANGCNPWPDNDSSYTFKRSKDMKKSSVHYNATAALAVAAGFNRCAAYILGLADEATDVATDYDKDLWLPFPSGVSESDAACSKLLNDEGIVVKKNIAGKSGGFLSPDFTFRSFSAKNGNEVNRESVSFHWNHSSADAGTLHICSSAVADPSPLDPAPDVTFRDMVTLAELRGWAESDRNPDNWYDPLNSCGYQQVDTSILNGPLSAYDPNSGDAKPGSLAAFGMYLHAEQDNFSHKECIGVNHDFIGSTDDTCGFVSGHFAGEFGAINNMPATGAILVTTPAALRPYRVALHSQATADALERTYDLLVELLQLHPELARTGSKDCGGMVTSFVTRFASIPNVVPASGKASGAKKRSDMADSLFASDSCTFNGLWND